ncbi:MAG TPA: helix-hairpin-helix domain-containing protein [Candidatus Eisenbacteria bacterium]|nr:helix-hairpin-helix domain-containing protein [Candidatus Eisenbacteria bacterium]
MGGREFRAVLAFVLVSLIAGAAYREWSGPEGPTFVERLRALEESAGLLDEEGAGAAALAGIDSAWAGGAGAFERGSAGSGSRRRASAPAPGRLDPDRATAAEWERLPGIGPALAARIVADRTSHGPFGTPSGLLRVRGIGPRTLERLRPFLRAAPVDSAPPIAN